MVVPHPDVLTKIASILCFSYRLYQACFFPQNNVSFFTLNDVKKDSSALGLRVQGPKSSVVERIQSLKKIFKDRSVIILDMYQTSIFWREIKNLEGYSNTSGYICKVSLPITNMRNFINHFENIEYKYFLDWGGNIAWCLLSNPNDIDQMRIFCLKHDGHLTVLRADDNFRKSDDFLTNSDSQLRILSKKLKESFDPKGILNSNKMYAGI